MPADITIDLVVLLFTALIGGVAALYFKQAIVTGYLLAGLFLGSYFFSVVKGVPNLDFLAQVGVALLMFSIGVEFSFERIVRVRRTIVLGALVQILVFILISTFLFLLLHFSILSSLIMAIAFSMSSTIIGAKLLTQNEKLETLEGEIALGWLILQDLAVIPLLILISVIGQHDNVFLLSLLAVIKSIAIIALVYVLGMELIPRLLDKLANLASHELLLLGTVLLLIVCSYLTSYFGLSAALGAFIAGLIVSKGFLNHQIALEIRPLRDIFAMFFFVSVGALLKPQFIFSSFLFIFLILLLVVLIKFLTTLFLIKGFGNHSKTSFFVASYLSQVGEFAFIVASTAKIFRVIDGYVYSIILSITLLTIIISPFLVKLEPYMYLYTERLTKRYVKFLYRYLFGSHEKAVSEDVIAPFVNVVICGYGRVGRNVGEILKDVGIGFSIVDYNKSIIDEAKQNNIHAIYGDPSNVEILTLASVENAKVIIITIPDPIISETVVRNALKLNENIKIIARSHLAHHRNLLEELGVHFIVEPEYEAALSIINKLMRFLGKSKKERKLLFR